jgi:hypothetical protein
MTRLCTAAVCFQISTLQARLGVRKFQLQGTSAQAKPRPHRVERVHRSMPL